MKTTSTRIALGLLALCTALPAQEPGKADDGGYAALAAAYPEAKPLGNDTCPVSGEAADGSKTVSWQGHEIAVCCGNSVGEFPNDAADYAAKAAGAN